MNKYKKEEIINFALKDIYSDLNYTLNRMIILRDFLNELLNMKTNKNIVYDFPRVVKYQKQKINAQKNKSKL